MLTARIIAVLRPRIGSALAESPGFAEGIDALLSSWSPAEEPIGALAARLEGFLFNALYDRLGSGMSLLMDNGLRRRFPMKETAEAVDDLLGVLFFSPRICSFHYGLIHAYWMETGSPAAMRCLYDRFSRLLPAEERSMLGRYLEENE